MQRRISIAIPASVASDTPHLREKTAKIGLIGRAAAIFKIDAVIIYLDNLKANQAADADMIAKLLSYMETPQYLRKKLFGLAPELQYAGVLPPLRTLHHPLNCQIKNLRIGEYREGVAVSQENLGSLVDIGVEQPILVRNRRLPLHKRTTVKIVRSGEKVEAETASRDDISEYWGYTVIVERHSFGRIVNDGGFDLTIATSRRGVAIRSIFDELDERWKKASKILVAFGAPTRGLNEIASEERLTLEETVDFVVNTIPNQGTETVRTEEALVASLAVLNNLGF